MKELTLGIRDLVTDILGTCGKQMILCAIDEEREFIDGKPTGKIANHIYDVVLPKRAYRHLLVKIPGPSRLTLNENGQNDVFVEFQGLTITPYAFISKNGNLVTGLTAKATGIRIVNGDNDKGREQRG